LARRNTAKTQSQRGRIVTQFKPNALQGRIFANIEKRNIEGKPLMLLTTRIWKARQSTSNLVSDPIYREFLKHQPATEDEILPAGQVAVLSG
jgi:hypothetical protein